MRLWDIQQTQATLGEYVCKILPFLHAITGCDTTSRLFGIGKPVALKKLMASTEYLKDYIEVFLQRTLSPDDVTKAGEEVIVWLYGGMPKEKLNMLRFRKFSTKIMTSVTHVQVHTIPPTSDAVKFHSLRAYLQCQSWINDDDDRDPTMWGWYIAGGKLLPTKSAMPPAPERLLKIIRCNCKVNCETKRCTCRKHGLDCSIGCGQCRGVSCTNSSICTETDVEEEGIDLMI